jgi:molybdate transport system permease protein
MHFTAVEIDAIILSLKVAVLCSLISLPFAIAIGWLLARKKFIGKVVLDNFVQLPLVMPPVTIGYLLLVFLGSNGLIGKYLYNYLGIRISFTLSAAVLAALIVSFPLVVRAVRVAFEMVSEDLEEAAYTLGASKWKTFRTITLPLAWPGIISGFILCFARSLGEFGATITFAGNISGVTQTLPLAIYEYMEVPGGEMAALRLVLVSIGISFAAMVGSEMLNRKLKKVR